MGKVWVLNTETKGTGANMVPLDRVTRRPSAAEPLFVAPAPPPRVPETPQPRQPRRFKVVELMTRRALVDDVNARDAVDALGGVRSVVDVEIYVSQTEEDDWRRLTFSERQAMWELARH
ncbi:MAG TPA: hypothetical protein VGH45_01855 [Solirubrobacteraceae bacterium]|jgi:hypothetical protein